MTALLDLLVAARRSGELVADVPPEVKPTTLDDAYAIADALAKALEGETVGWKIGASISRAWERLGLHEPFGGRIFASTVYESPASIADIPGTLTIGAEFAMRIARDLGMNETFDSDSIRAVVGAVYPVLELNRPDYAAPMEVGGLSLIADNGVNVGLVRGAPMTPWQQIELSQVKVTFRVNGEEKSSGTAADIHFTPFTALAWLANDRARRSDPLKTGQFVSTGDLIMNVEANQGDHVAADFGSFGIVELHL
jgi:2-keto-4-pentenoate hydratase